VEESGGAKSVLEGDSESKSKTVENSAANTQHKRIFAQNKIGPMGR
jgi:hypothetical protein